MNKISELQARAFSECKRYDDDCGDNLVKTDEVFAKFAELIVKECAAEAHRRVCIEGNDNMIYAHLLEHFGVEE